MWANETTVRIPKAKTAVLLPFLLTDLGKFVKMRPNKPVMRRKYEENIESARMRDILRSRVNAQLTPCFLAMNLSFTTCSALLSLDAQSLKPYFSRLFLDTDNLEARKPDNPFL